MSLIRKHVAVLQAWACLDLVIIISSSNITVHINTVCQKQEKQIPFRPFADTSTYKTKFVI